MGASLFSNKKSTTVRTDSEKREDIIAARQKRAQQAVKVVSWLSEKRPAQTARLAHLLWSMSRRSERPNRESKWLTTGKSCTVPSGLGLLQAWEWGAGPTILLVHGWDGRGSQLGAFVAPLVQAGFRVVTYDSRGNGDSFGRRASLVSFADALTAMVRHMGPLHGIVAHSFGAAATLYALRSGLSVPRVVFLGPVNAAHGADRFARFLKMSPTCADLFKQEVYQRMGDSFENLNGKALPSATRPELLLYHDRDDVFVPADDAREIASNWPGSHLIETSGLGHHRILRDAEIIAESISYFQFGTMPRVAQHAA